jgi:hypothetical protein
LLLSLIGKLSQIGHIIREVKEQHPPQASPPEPAGFPQEEEATLRLGIHDLSRIEWTAVLGLPPDGVRRYHLEFTVEIPTNLYSPTNMWDYVQQFTRLQSPEESGALQIDRKHPDELRRDVLGVTHRLKLLRERFERTALGASSLLVEALHPQLEANLTQVIDQATAMVQEVRTALLREPSNAGHIPPPLMREWELADEWISHQLLDFLAAAQRGLDKMLLGPNSRIHELDSAWTERITGRLADALEQEIHHREHQGLLNPRPDSPSELSTFVERASHLKKHFQDVLFLDVQAFQVDFRVRNWTAVVAASLAAVFWLGFTLLPIAPGARAGIGIGAFGAAFAIAYALKDRVKEITRFWLAGQLTRLYGQRMVTLRLPQRADPERRAVLDAREKFDVETRQAEDPLNTTAQATRRVMLIRYDMRADVHACVDLGKSRIHSLKHIFRWDLTPIFSRLDNAVKAVPVLDPETRRVRFVDAPKEYRLPVQLTCDSSNGRLAKTEALLVISKHGLERLESFVEKTQERVVIG